MSIFDESPYLAAFIASVGSLNILRARNIPKNKLLPIDEPEILLKSIFDSTIVKEEPLLKLTNR